ncbi:O-antigen ligase family protein [Acidobacteriota bacterium]
MKTKISLTPQSYISLAIAFYLLFSLISISLSQIFLFIAFLSWLFFLIKEKQKPLVPSFFWSLSGYALLSLVSSFFSVNPEISLKDSRELLLFLLVPIVFTGFSTEKILKKANLALLASAILSCIYSFFHLAIKNGLNERLSGFMGHYMTQAGLLLIFSTMALSLFLFSREKARFLWGIGYLLSLTALAFTLTRSAWIGLIISSSLILFLYKPKALILAPIAVGLFFIVGPQQIKDRAFSIFSLKSDSNRERIEYLNAGLHIIKDFPLFGSGPNTVEMVFQHPKYSLSKKAKSNVHLHNNFLQIGAERGLPALLTWIAFFVWTFFSLIKLLRNKDPALYPFTVAALAALTALMTAGFFEYNFGDSEITALFLYMITVPFCLNRIQNIKSVVKEKKASEVN